MRRNKNYSKQTSTRICYKCLIEKNVSLFEKDKRKPFGRGYVCQDCKNDMTAFYRHEKRKNPSKLVVGLRWKILHKFNFTCQYCGRKAPDIAIQVDHIVPLSKGGKYVEENLTVSCKECNRGKSDFLI